MNARLLHKRALRTPLRSVKLILPALTEATSPHWRPIKYSLFPPLGLATLAAYLDPDLEISLQDEHVEKLDLSDQPDLVIIQVYITNAYRAYQIADHYRARGSYVVLGGLHVTSLPDEAARTQTRSLSDPESTPSRNSCKTWRQERHNAATSRRCVLWKRCRPYGGTLFSDIDTWSQTRLSSREAVPIIAPSATRTVSSQEGAHSIRRSWTTRLPKLPAFPADIFTFWTTISSGMAALREISSTA